MQSQNLGAGTHDLPASWLLTNPGSAGGFLFGVTNNLYWRKPGEWILLGDRANNGGSAILSSNGNSSLQFYVIPSIGGADHMISNADLPNFLQATLDVNGQFSPAVEGQALGGAHKRWILNATAVNASAKVQVGTVPFIKLGGAKNGALIYCSDCQRSSSCKPGGSGAIAKGIAGIWSCD